MSLPYPGIFSLLKARERTVWSNKVPSITGGSEPGLTVFTAVDSNRLHALEAQCRSWPGPLAVGMFLTLNHTQAGTQMDDQAADVLAQHTAAARSLFSK